MQIWVGQLKRHCFSNVLQCKDLNTTCAQELNNLMPFFLLKIIEMESDHLNELLAAVYQSCINFWLQKGA